jgi:hypothetical protein
MLFELMLAVMKCWQCLMELVYRCYDGVILVVNGGMEMLILSWSDVVLRLCSIVVFLHT